MSWWQAVRPGGRGGAATRFRTGRTPVRVPPAVLDGPLAVVVTVVALLGAYGESYPTQPEYAAPLGNPVPHVPLAEFALVIASGGVLAWRRRHPEAVWALSLAAALAYTALGRVNGAVVIAPMVALYTVVTVRRRLRDAAACGLVTAAACYVVGGVFGPFGWNGGGQDVIPFVIVAVVSGGVAVADRRSLMAELAARADLAERTREEEARRRVDAERVRIARELHDVVAHTMATIGVQAAAALHTLDDAPEQAREGLRAIRSEAKEGLAELRSVLDVLRSVDRGEDEARGTRGAGGTPPAPPASGLAHLDALVAGTTAAGVRTTLDVRGGPRRLPAAVDLAAYRIVQESLTNAVRHSGSGAASVVLTFGEDGLDIDVSDEGAPEPVTAASARQPGSPSTADPRSASPGGHGLRGMAERAGALGGSVRAGPTGTGGFRVHATLPIGGPR